MLAASRAHLDEAAVLEAKDDLQGALREYTRANDFDPPTGRSRRRPSISSGRIRARIEAARPKPTIDQLKERVRQRTEPVLSPTSKVPLRVRFPNANVREVLNFIASQSGINITYDRAFKGTDQYTIDLDGVTLEQALQQIMIANNLFYKVLNERTIIVADDNAQNRAQVRGAGHPHVLRVERRRHRAARQFSTASRARRAGVDPPSRRSWPTRSTNTITVRGTAGQVAIIERIIDLNDRPRAEVIVDVEILEVNRSRAKQYGLNLSDYAIGLSFSPEQAPGTAQAAATGRPFNLNTISQGVNTADFYASVPVGGGAVPRERLRDQAHRQAAAPRPGGREAHLQPRRADPGAVHHLRAVHHRRRRDQPANVVPRTRTSASTSRSSRTSRSTATSSWS